jgi:hypothetical protein
MTRASRAIFVTCILALTTVASMAADTLEEAVAAYRKADYAAKLFFIFRDFRHVKIYQ